MAKRALSNVSTVDIQAELRRRQQKLPALQRKQKKLLADLAEVENQLAALGISASKRTAAGAAPRGRRPKNKRNLADTLASVLSKTKPMRVIEAVAAVKKAGYKTTSNNFNTIVNQTLLKDKKRFKQTGRGKYVVKA